MATDKETVFAVEKYESFVMLFARWLKLSPSPEKLCYVTLGGPDLGDIKKLLFIDRNFHEAIYSVEKESEYYELAKSTADILDTKLKININVIKGDIFKFKRMHPNIPHLFFFDIFRNFACGDNQGRIGDMFRTETIKEGDTLFITSSLSDGLRKNPVIKKMNGLYTLLKISDEDDQFKCFRRTHSAYTLFNALESLDLHKEINVNPLGCIEYKNSNKSTLMGLYGFTINAGSTKILELIDQSYPFRRIDGVTEYNQTTAV